MCEHASGNPAPTERATNESASHFLRICFRSRPVTPIENIGSSYALGRPGPTIVGKRQLRGLGVGRKEEISMRADTKGEQEISYTTQYQRA